MSLNDRPACIGQTRRLVLVCPTSIYCTCKSDPPNLHQDERRRAAITGVESCLGSTIDHLVTWTHQICRDTGNTAAVTSVTSALEVF